jgi:ABC-type transport system involved in multi-copper enzyme maturation permease subunit
MSSNAITEKQDPRSGSGGGLRPREVAPSVLRDDEAQFARWIGTFGLVFTLVGADLLAWALFGRSLIGLVLRLITQQTTIGLMPTILATLFFVIGLLGMLFHATCEKETQLRRAYGGFGALWVAAGLFFIVCQMAGMGWAASFFLPGFSCLAVGLLYLLAYLRNEEETDWHNMALYVVGGVGAALALTGFVGGSVRSEFLVPNGLLLALLGLGYLWSFVVVRGHNDELGERAGLGIAGVGLIVFVIALVRSYIVPLFSSAAGGYAIPSGILLMALGLLYAGLVGFFRSENKIVVMTRRELATFFLSPIAYLVLIGFTVVAWFALLLFLDRAIFVERGQEPLFEPIVRAFFFGLIPVFAILFIVPVITMRSLSEERRTGTLEVLLTVPVDEFSVVLSKFLATLGFFMIVWLPWGLFLVALRIIGGESFDFRPLLSFLIVLLFTGANFAGMGLFFSSITRNQIISAVLTFSGMLGLFFIYFGVFMLRNRMPTSPWIPVLNHMSFVDLWFNSLDGKLQPQYLIFHLSATVFWLFLTVKVLEARKWS